ncbi:MAG: hypothetical protein JSW60_02740 [Thermoplasmatales archaeon]|nr:MAG: hypothetical protein JSW60_02740 [Thermoplasmatales archaeon]
MKKKIIIGSLLAVFLMMMPSVSAVESNAVKEKTRYSFIESDIDIEELKEEYNKNPSAPLFIIVTALIWFLKLLRIFLVTFWTVVILSIIKRITGNTTCIIG